MSKVRKCHPLGFASGTIDGVTYYQKNGATIARTATSRGKNKRGKAQVENWCRMRNLQNIYDGMAAKPFFQDKQGAQSDRSCFIHANKALPMPYLTRDAFAKGQCVPAPRLILTDGNLRPISVRLMTDDVGRYLCLANIRVDDRHGIAFGVRRHNADYRQNDLLRLHLVGAIVPAEPRTECRTTDYRLGLADMELVLGDDTGCFVRHGRLCLRLPGSCNGYAVTQLRLNDAGHVVAASRAEYGECVSCIDSFRTPEMFEKCFISFEGRE